jgi:hypothetical protein
MGVVLVPFHASMTDPLQGLALSRTLWLIVAPPVVGFVWHLCRAFRVATHTPRAVAGRRSVAPEPPDPWVPRVGIGAVLLAGAATLGYAARLSRAPAGIDGFVQRGLGAAHTGLHQGALGLAFDQLSGSACTLACAVALVAALVVRRTDARKANLEFAWLNLALAGGLLTFLAEGLVTTVLGWTVLGMAAAWLAGWDDRRAGAVRATRGAMAVLALLLASSPFLGSFEPTTPALVALLVAVAALSSATPPPGAPRELAAVGSGATFGVAGPYLLLRIAPVSQLLAGHGRVIALGGAVMLAAVLRKALDAPRATPAATRWLALLGGAPAALTCISLGTDGVRGASFVLLSGGLTVSLLLLAGALVATSAPAIPAGTPVRRDFEHALLESVPEAGGALLVAFERSVVDSIGGFVGVVVHAMGWAAARLDTELVGAPANAVAVRTVRLGRVLEPLVGGSLVRVAWILVGGLGLVALARTLWIAP